MSAYPFIIEKAKLPSGLNFPTNDVYRRFNVILFTNGIGQILLILISDNVHSVGHISVRGSIFAREHCSRVFINFLCVRLGTIKLFKYCESILIVRWE